MERGLAQEHQPWPTTKLRLTALDILLQEKAHALTGKLPKRNSVIPGHCLQLVEFIIAGSGGIFSAIFYAGWYMSVEKSKTYGTDPDQIPMAYISLLPFLALMVMACLIFINDTSQVKAAIKSRIRE